MHTITWKILLEAALLALAISGAAAAVRLLSIAGAVAACVVGFAVFAFGGLPLALPLLVFFITSSILSHLGGRRKAEAAALAEKTRQRDAWQVLANGAVPATLAVLAWREGSLDIWMMALGALATANADTWATEIGTLWPGRPRLLADWRPVPPGTSGAVSALGLLAALAGAAAIALAGWLAWPPYSLRLVLADSLPEVLVVVWAGFLGGFADSILGASVQAQYRCTSCGALTERSEHCGGPAKPARGWAWVNNDVVNLTACLLGALFVGVMLRLLQRAVGS